MEKLVKDFISEQTTGMNLYINIFIFFISFVALLDCSALIEAQKYCESVGYDYNLEFIPHVTVARGESQVEAMSHLIGKEVVMADCYIRCKDFK